jgi:hypothetical protein
VQPFEVVCSPYTVYAASVGASFPLTDASPSTAWTLVGTSGNKNYTDTGVTVTHTQTVSTFTPAGSTTVRKAWRTDEGLTVGFELADLSPSMYALLLDNISVSTVVASTAAPGDSHFEVMRGVEVNQYALLVRGISPVNEAYTAQYEISSAFQMGNPAPRYSKQGPATLVIEFHAYELTPGHLATWRAQSAPLSGSGPPNY